MNKKTSRILGAVLAVMMIAGVATGCDEGSASSDAASGTSSAASSAASAASSAASSEAVVSVYVPEDGKVDAVVNVKDYGAVGDGVADDTKAIKAALSAAKQKKLPTYLPEGTYRLTDSMVLTSQTLMGYDVQNWPEDQDKLPTILIDQTERAGIFASNAAISGVHITFADINSKGPAVNPLGTGCRIHNMKITNAPSGIVFSEEGATGNPGRSNIENVIMEGIDSVGLHVTGTLDVPYVGNVTVSGTSDNFKKNGKAFVLGQNDDIRMINCTAIGAHIGYAFVDLDNTVEETGLTRSTWGSLVDCKAEDVEIGIDVTSQFPHFVMQPVTLNRMTIDAKINAVNTYDCRAQMTICDSTLKSSSGPTLQVDGGDALVFQNCEITASGSNDAVKIISTLNTVISGSKIKAGGKGVVIEKCNPKAILIANNTITSGGTKISDKLPADANKLFADNK